VIRLAVGLAATGALALVVAAGAATASRGLEPGTRFYVPPPDSGATKQILDLVRTRDLADAVRLGAMVAHGHAVWFTSGTPQQVEQQVRRTMLAAAFQRAVPVLVAYDVPFRDCGQYSSGGALNTADYLAWIDGFARGIGNGKAVVILEPDGLGIIPYNTTIFGAEEWCKPDLSGTGLTPEQANAARYDQINGAVDRLEQQPNTAVYLDGTHAAWLGDGDAAYRLVRAGVQRAQGFFVNVSNYQSTHDNGIFGTWVSDCITSATGGGAPWAAGHFDWCPSQYDPALGYQVDYSDAYVASVNAAFAGLLGGASPTTRFVIDTSRNGQGPWTPTVQYPDAQDWCNPPGRGVGARPTASPGTALVDAYLWVKVPGESDGSCNRGIQGSTTDPEWGGIVDPAAGDWFVQQALQLAQLANPPLP
jgi:endoglucanase